MQTSALQPLFDKHTPGPWSYSKCQCNQKGCNKFYINHSWAEGMFEEPDARLIAAAPELLEALEEAHNQLVTNFAYAQEKGVHFSNERVNMTSAAKLKIRTAITKARGQA